LDPEPQEIVPAAAMPGLFDALRRVEVRWPASRNALAWETLADEIAAERQVLAIVHRRADAAILWTLVNERAPGSMHLSALLCPAHRRQVLTEMRRRLARGDDCRVVSTQLVEAGVDVDFPVVYRAMAGFESLAQSAGRCNREGRLHRGAFRVFRAPTEPPATLRHHLQIAEAMLAGDPGLDLLEPRTFRAYFERLYHERDRDARRIQPLRQELLYERTAAEFRMIDEATTTVFIPFDVSARRAIEYLRHAGPSRERFRALQPYGVSVFPADLRKLQERGAVELVQESVWTLVSIDDYHQNLGLVVDGEGSERYVI
jgi:CRISPR-associated endonuclease/helicase Cas3